MKNRTEAQAGPLDPAAPRPGLDRRKFLAIGGALSAAGILAACSKSDSDGSKSTTTVAKGTATTVAGSPTTAVPATAKSAAQDLKLGAFAAALEVLAVNTYGAALDAAGKGSLGTVPPAVGQFVTTAKAQHQAHLDSWNKVLTGAGQPAVTEPPAALAATVNKEFAKVTDVAGAATLALMLEEIAAATYLSVIPLLATEAPIKLASSIQPIDMQHAAILNFALGKYPVPDSFATTTMAVSP